MTKPSRIAAYLITVTMAAALMSARVQSANDEPPPVPYGTQQSMKLKALVEAAPFMAASEDDVHTLMQERLRVSVSIFESQAERVDLGRLQLDALAQPIGEVKLAWVALSATPDHQMPILKFVLQLAEHREKAMEALTTTGQVATLERLEAKRDRMTAEIELAQCQRAMSNASVR